MIKQLHDYFQLNTSSLPEIESKVQQLKFAMDGMSASSEPMRKVYFTGIDYSSQPVAGLYLQEQHKSECTFFEVPELHSFSHHCSVETSPFVLPMMNAKKILGTIKPRSSMNIFVNNLSCLSTFIVLISRCIDGDYNIYLDLKGEDMPDFLSATKNLYILDTTHDVNYDVAVLSNSDKDELISVFDRLNVNAQCFLIAPFLAEDLSLDTYKYIHQKRIELIGWNETNIFAGLDVDKTEIDASLSEMAAL